MVDLVHTEIASPVDGCLSDKRINRRKIVRATYDAAQTTSDNTRHWTHADGLSADAALNPSVRSILRSRSRYEVCNNSYARGIINTLANDTVGTGPRLQLRSEDNATNQRIERAFAEWAKEVQLAQKLRTMRMARAVDGEAFVMLTTNRHLNSPVKLDLALAEADRVTNPWQKILVEPGAVDGIEYDMHGNPTRYYVLKQHPGDVHGGVDNLAFSRVPAESMIHWFRIERPGQHRGVPEITPALPLFAQLRRYTLAVLAAAETAADFAAVIYTDSPADGEAAEVEPMDVVELEKRLATTLPYGWKLGQLKSEQPTTTYSEFKKEILNEIARCLNMPFNIAAGNSAGYNYSSGRLDHQTYYKSIYIDQRDMEQVVLVRVFARWMAEAILVSDLIPIRWRTMPFYPHQWFWDGHEHVDPAKEATAQAKRLESHTTTLANEYAKSGLDWEAELEQRAKEVQRMKKLGLPLPGATVVDESQDDEDADEETPQPTRKGAA